MGLAGKSEYSRKLRSPLKIFDYMAVGKPIIATKCESHTDILKNNYNALFYKSGDFIDLAHKIKKVSLDIKVANSLALNAWKDSEEYTYLNRAKIIKKFISF